MDGDYRGGHRALVPARSRVVTAPIVTAVTSPATPGLMDEDRLPLAATSRVDCVFWRHGPECPRLSQSVPAMGELKRRHAKSGQSVPECPSDARPDGRGSSAPRGDLRVDCVFWRHGPVFQGVPATGELPRRHAKSGQSVPECPRVSQRWVNSRAVTPSPRGTTQVSMLS